MKTGDFDKIHCSNFSGIKDLEQKLKQQPVVVLCVKLPAISTRTHRPRFSIGKIILPNKYSMINDISPMEMRYDDVLHYLGPVNHVLITLAVTTLSISGREEVN